MSRSVVLRGYTYSVYTRIARLALQEKGVLYEFEEVDPFQGNFPKGYLKRHPFGRVPVLSHGTFDVFETAAILRYVDAAFDGQPLLPDGAQEAARVSQVMSIVDNYGYQPMIRQVFAHRVFRQAVGEVVDEAEIAAGLTEAGPVLSALNSLAMEGRVLNGRNRTLADCHLAPMIAYFVQAPEGRDALGEYPALAHWWASVSQWESLLDTDPGLPIC